jgi:1-deoxy-D-xylulose-5-phosphate reductoisomerase
MKRITVLGATGSIGLSTLDVIARHPDRFEVFALSGHRQVARLAEQCARHRPRFAVTLEEDAAHELRTRLAALDVATEVLSGIRALEEVAAHAEVDLVMAAIVGAAGLRPALAAARAGKRILLANKETLVMSGALFMRAVHEHGATLLPIDSEHNAIFQALPEGFGGDLDAAGVKSIWLTASGGPFRTWDAARLRDVTPEQAVAHPNWSMGRKISVDSASLMNKGLEVIEARWLFNAPAQRIQVVVHPQSIIHSMVEYLDGSVIAQLGNPDMRTPIAHALGFPERIAAGVDSLSLFGRDLTFESPDTTRFPCLALAFAALESGGVAPCVLNAANEVAVAEFLAGRCGFLDIPAAIEHALARVSGYAPDSLDELHAADAEARRATEDYLARNAGAQARSAVP